MRLLPTGAAGQPKPEAYAEAKSAVSSQLNLKAGLGSMPAASSKYLILPSYSMEKRNPFTHHSLAVSFPGLANSTHTFAISNSVVLFGKDSFSSKLGRPLQPVKVGLDSVRQPLNPVNRIDLLVPQGDDGFRQALANAAQLSFSSSERPEPAPNSMAIKFPIVGKCDC